MCLVWLHGRSNFGVKNVSQGPRDNQSTLRDAWRLFGSSTNIAWNVLSGKHLWVKVRLHWELSLMCRLGD